MAQATARKIAFLVKHVPGMKDIRQPKTAITGKAKPHDSYFFKKASYSKGHKFLTQGVPADDMIYVVSSGCIEMRRVEKPNKATASRSPKRGMPSRESDDDADDVGDREGNTAKMGILLEGSVFGSLPFAAPEPFTLVSISPCEVFCITGADFKKIDRGLLQTIQDHLARSLTWRLARLQSDRASAVKRKDLPHQKEDVSPLPYAAQTYGYQLMQNGKIHPHPMLLKGNSAQKEMLLRMRYGCQTMSAVEQLPSPFKSASSPNLTARSQRSQIGAQIVGASLQKRKGGASSVDRLPSLT
jgi:CRP-like cAMP-binding protein